MTWCGRNRWRHLGKVRQEHGVLHLQLRWLLGVGQPPGHADGSGNCQHTSASC
jgi:hypothetical protein